MQGATPDEVKAKLGKILQGGDPPHSEDAVAALLGDAGFEPPMRFFSSLFWGAWITRWRYRGDRGLRNLDSPLEAAERVL